MFAITLISWVQFQPGVAKTTKMTALPETLRSSSCCLYYDVCNRFVFSRYAKDDVQCVFLLLFVFFPLKIIL